LAYEFNGQNPGDLFGTSVSLSSFTGTRIAIGAPQYDDDVLGKNDAGRVYAFELGKKDKSSFVGDEAGEKAGSAVAISHDGTTIAIAAPGPGRHVGVYDFATGAQIGPYILDATTSPASGEIAPLSVSLNAYGTVIAIGTPEASTVRIFQLLEVNDAYVWSPLGQVIKGLETGDGHGFSVSLSTTGMRIAIGAPKSDQNETEMDSGYVRVFEMRNGSWTQKGQTIFGKQGDEEGNSVSLAIDGTRLATGAIGRGSDRGGVRIFDFITAAWSVIGDNIPGDELNEKSGWSVSLAERGHRVAIGSPFYNSTNGDVSGQVRIYELSSTRKWVKVDGSIIGEDGGDESGYSVSLSRDGCRVAIGAPFNNGNRGNNTGQVRIFDDSCCFLN
jgi:hypothetical protein